MAAAQGLRLAGGLGEERGSEGAGAANDRPVGAIDELHEAVDGYARLARHLLASP